MGGTNCCFTFSQYLFGMAFTEKNAGKPQIPLVTFIIFPTALPVVRPTQRVCDNSEEFLDPNIRRFFPRSEHSEAWTGRWNHQNADFTNRQGWGHQES